VVLATPRNGDVGPFPVDVTKATLKNSKAKHLIRRNDDQNALANVTHFMGDAIAGGQSQWSPAVLDIMQVILDFWEYEVAMS